MGHRSPAVRHGGQVTPPFRVKGQIGAGTDTAGAMPGRGAPARGFTLVEVMIAVAIIAILAAIAIPNYSRYVVRSHRAAIESFMLEVSGAQERFLVDNRAYAASLGALGMSVPAAQSTRYNVTVTPNGALPPGYSIVATPTGSQLSADTGCGTLTLTSAGARSASGGGTDCWN
ncbi:MULTISPECIES: type IV pilin protein [unclassified Cupriavidus]|uniref:type IV pilin protein n=1 Tax=unclassified Cupriavidus TaxID=2640874 RepID=UPI0004909721|nr:MULTISPECIES: type IV pilin protein [unclassified Cupriavidus]MBP0627376.1 prepilin-type N-terminal cleavage/methylation domain-containing protein [Cupriavidus sp. AcVe19-1a]